MIDLQTEQIIPLVEVNRLPFLPGRNGKKLAYSTVWRWALRGVRGHRLESLRLGGKSVTSIEAVERFIHKLNGGGQAVGGLAPSQIRKQHLAAEAALEKAGY